MRINPIKKISFSFVEVQCFYILKEFRTKIVQFFFNFVHMNVQNFRHFFSWKLSIGQSNAN